MKRFMYFENTDGGTNWFAVYSEDDLRSLYGWKDSHCKRQDQELLDWMGLAEIGDFFAHRLGVLVRVKDAAVAAGCEVPDCDPCV